MHGAGRIQTSQIVCSVQHIDVVAFETCREQSVDGLLRIITVRYGSRDSIGRIRNELIAAGDYVSSHDAPCMLIMSAGRPYVQAFRSCVGRRMRRAWSGAAEATPAVA
jgi:hypothetical protein